MSRERWGTFSVVDHQRPKAFVAEVLLYDRLIIPIPPDQGERKRWTEIGRKPDQLDAALEILGELAIPVPWDKQKHETFKTIYEDAKKVNFDVLNIQHAKQNNSDPLYVTRKLLTHEFLPELPKGVAKVWALAAYPSFNKYEEDMAIYKTENQTNEKQRENLAMVLSHRFLVPDNPDKSGNSDIELLKKVVKISKREDFKENRMKFYKWQEDIIEQGITDKKALEEMEQYLEKYNKVVKKSSNEVRLKYGFLLIKLGLSISGIILGQVEPILSGIIEVISFGKFERKPNIYAGECEAAAMIYDVHKEFKNLQSLHTQI
jgi:hypothetical protein